MSKEINNEVLKDAQYRKGLSIAFFNATNASIELAKVMFPDMPAVDAKVFIQEWREWFIEEHKNYYLTVIANVGVNYKPEDTIAKLNKTTTKSELAKVWMSLTEDERANPEVHAVKETLKKKYETVQLD